MEKGRFKTQFPSGFKSSSCSRISDFGAFLLLCQDLMWLNKIMDWIWRCRATIHSQVFCLAHTVDLGAFICLFCFNLLPTFKYWKISWGILFLGSLFKKLNNSLVTANSEYLCARLYSVLGFWCKKNAAMKLKDTYSLEEKL